MGGITRGIANRLGAGGVGSNFRNILINGDMSVDQRGSATGQTGDKIGSGADRFYVRVNARTNFAYSMENSTDVPSGEGFSNSHKITTTTAETSLGSAGILRYGQRIEGNMLKGLRYGTTNAQKVVVQFWVKCSVTGTFVFELWNRKSNYYNSKSFTIDSANTWQKIIKTFDGDTVNDFTIDNSVQLEANVWWAGGTSFTSSGTVTGGSWNNDATKRAGGLSNAFTTTLNATFFTTGWQLEIGTSTSAFEFLPRDINLDRCYRYFYKFIPQSGTYPNYCLATYNGTSASGFLHLPKPMRSGSLTLTSNGTFVSNNPYGGSSYDNISSGPSIGDVCQNIVRVGFDIPNSKTAGSSGRLLITGESDAFIALADEL